MAEQITPITANERTILSMVDNLDRLLPQLRFVASGLCEYYKDEEEHVTGAVYLLHRLADELEEMKDAAHQSIKTGDQEGNQP